MKCIRTWCPNPAAPGRKLCAHHLELALVKNRLRRQRRREHGLCTSCGECPPDPGTQTCGGCKAVERERGRERARRKSEAGECQLCPRDAVPGGKRCSKHVQAQKHQKARRQARLRAQNRCDCGGPLPCAGCRAVKALDSATRYQRRRAQGLCVRCGEPATNGGALCAYHCQAIKRSTQERYQRRVLLGVCVNCGKQPAQAGERQCISCSAARQGEQRAQRDARRAAGLCTKCGQVSVKRYAICTRCRRKRNDGSERSR